MKRILFSIGLIGMVFTSNAQSLFSENFNALTAGNLASDMNGGTPGQNNWYYFADAGTPANFATVLSVGTNDNGLKLTGSSSASSNSNNPRFAFQTFDWSSRTAGNDILYVSYKMNTGASSSSTNTFRTVAYDSKGRIIIGLSYKKSTKEIQAILYDSLGSAQGQSGTFSAQLAGTSNAPLALTLTDNTVYDLAFAYNVNTGVIYVFGQDLNGNILFQKAFLRTYANSKMGFPSEFDVYAIAGTANAATSNVTYDDIDVHANLCLFYDHKENATFAYTSNSTCKLATAFSPTKTDQAVNGVFSSSNGLSITAATGAIDLANSTAGAYSIKFKTDGSTGCIDSTSINVTLKDLPAVPTIQASGATTFCQGGSVNLSITPANSTTYLWSDNSTNTTLSAIASGSYTVTATSNGCSSTSMPTVVTVNTIPSTPTITAGGATTFCQGNNVALNVTSPVNGVTYNWSNSSTGTSLNATTAATYSVTASNGGCNSSASNSISVTVNTSPAVPTIQASGTTTFCQGGNVNLSVTPANSTTYLWSDNSTNTTLNATTSGSYTVTATSNGCSSTSTPTVVTVNAIPSTPTITAGGATTFCSGSNVALNVTSPVNGVTYNWSNSSTGTSLNATTAATYSVTASNGGCNSSASNSISVTVNNSPAVPTIQASGTTTFCQGGNVNLSVTPANSTTYLWSDNSTNTTLNATTSGSYTVTATSNGCSSTSTPTVVTVNAIPSTPTITAGGATTFCLGSNVALNVTSPVNGVTYNWSNSSTGTSLNATTAATYSVTASNGGCNSSASNSIVVTVNPTTTPTFTTPAAICVGGTAPVLSTTSNNSIVGTWNPSTVSNSATGTYIFTANSGTCVNTASVTVTVNSATVPTFTIASTLCSGASAPTLPTTSNNSIAGTWSPSVVSNTASNSYTFTPTGNSCVSPVVVPITVTSSVTPTFATIQPICLGAVAPTLPTTSTNSITGTWSPSVVNNLSTGIYLFTPSSSCASTYNATVIVTPNSPTSFNFGTSICTGATAPILPSTSIESVPGTWSPSTVSNTTSGSYLFTPSSGVCATTKTVAVTVSSVVIPAFNLPSIVCTGSVAPTLPLTSTNSVSGTWSPSTVSTTTSQSYLFTPSNGSCASLLATAITVSSCAGIDETNTSLFKVYPNPSSDVITISFSDLISNNGTINFVAADGKLIEKREYTNSSIITFDVKSLNPGVYFFQIGNTIEKVVVQ